MLEGKKIRMDGSQGYNDVNGQLEIGGKKNSAVSSQRKDYYC